MKAPDIYQFIVLGLATYRVSRLVVVDSFPPAAALRKWFKYHWPDAGDTVSRIPKRGTVQAVSPQGTDPRDVERWRVISGTSLGYLVSCMWCTPFWVAVCWWLAFSFWPEVTTIGAVPWALAAVASSVYNREH